MNIYTIWTVFIFTYSSLVSKKVDPTDLHRINYISEPEKKGKKTHHNKKKAKKNPITMK